MSFKKNYFIHAQNIDLYGKTFPHLSATLEFGPVCSTDFNKVWRYSRGEYIPSSDGSGRTIKNSKSSQKRSTSLEQSKRKKIKQNTIVSNKALNTCSVLLKLQSTSNEFEPLITLLRLDYNSFPSFCNFNDTFTKIFKEEVENNCKEAFSCYSIPFRQVEIESILLISNNQQHPVDEIFLRNLINGRLLQEGTTFHIEIKVNR